MLETNVQKNNFIKLLTNKQNILRYVSLDQTIKNIAWNNALISIKIRINIRFQYYSIPYINRWTRYMVYIFIIKKKKN